jgi:hypothetical protein
MQMKTERFPNKMSRKPYIKPAGPPLSESVRRISMTASCGNSLLEADRKNSAGGQLDYFAWECILYTNMLSQVHIRPQDNPVMLTSPKRRYVLLAIPIIHCQTEHCPPSRPVFFQPVPSHTCHGQSHGHPLRPTQSSCTSGELHRQEYGDPLLSPCR